MDCIDQGVAKNRTRLSNSFKAWQELKFYLLEYLRVGQDGSTPSKCTRDKQKGGQKHSISDSIQNCWCMVTIKRRLTFSQFYFMFFVNPQQTVYFLTACPQRALSLSASPLGPGSLAETDVRVQAEAVAKSTPSHTCADVLLIYQHTHWLRHALTLSNRHLWLPGGGLP